MAGRGEWSINDIVLAVSVKKNIIHLYHSVTVENFFSRIFWTTVELSTDDGAYEKAMVYKKQKNLGAMKELEPRITLSELQTI